MERKDYQMPTMKVVELRNRTQLLAGSGEEVHDGDVDATMNGTFEEHDI